MPAFQSHDGREERRMLAFGSNRKQDGYLLSSESGLSNRLDNGHGDISSNAIGEYATFNNTDHPPENHRNQPSSYVGPRHHQTPSYDISEGSSSAYRPIHSAGSYISMRPEILGHSIGSGSPNKHILNPNTTMNTKAKGSVSYHPEIQKTQSTIFNPFLLASNIYTPAFSIDAHQEWFTKNSDFYPYSDSSSSPSPYVASSRAPQSGRQSEIASFHSENREELYSTQPRPTVLQPSQRHNLFRQNFRSEANEYDIQRSQCQSSIEKAADDLKHQEFRHQHISAPRTSGPSIQQQYEGLADLSILARSWFDTHITSLDDALRHVPLEELGKQAVMIGEPYPQTQGTKSAWNIVKLENIPYNLDDDMLSEFLGRNAGLVPEEHGGVHIIMDRTTGKTMDCFLEFPSVESAERFIQKRCTNNRRCILGGRHISLELVKHGELMRWLFPKIKGALWDDDGALKISAVDVSEFQIDIISKEELVMILGHARTPHRSPFSRKCLQRPYESMMSVITKFPWKETEKYTLKQRDMIYQAAYEAGELLKRHILRGKAGPNIDLKLLKRLCRTISFCPGFTYRQKWVFLDAMGITTSECFTILGDLGISHPLATQFQALTVKPGSEYIAVEVIANLVASGALQLTTEPSTDMSHPFVNGDKREQHSAYGSGCPSKGSECSNTFSCTEASQDVTMRVAAGIELERVYTAITNALLNTSV